MQQKNYNKQIAYWLLFGGFMVLMMVIIGGITRLTHSGLSIVTWQPIKGILPPLNEAQWEQAFEAYKKIPEYQKVHHYFSLKEYKEIFFWEYLHRMLGRSLGLIFLLPFLYFYFKKRIQNKKLLRRLFLIFLLGGIQGLAGWYMVKSGLVENTSVDHVRLALHMSLALIILTTILWTVFQLIIPTEKTENHKKLHFYLKGILFFMALQIIYGGLTAGLKAGHVFPTYPKMGGQWFPEISKSVFHQEGFLSLVDFSATVQFIHRWLGFLLLIGLLSLFLFRKKKLSSPLLVRVLLLILILVSLQYLFGVFVIVLKVPISLAVTHQITAFILFLSLLMGIYLTKKRNDYFQ